MRTTYMAIAAATALALTAPAAGQSSHGRTYSQQLLVQLNAGLSAGTISPNESLRLRSDLGRLINLERSYRSNGIGSGEYAVLMQRSITLANGIRVASRDHSSHTRQSTKWEGRVDTSPLAVDPRFAAYPDDRFPGDTRIGQYATANIVNLPVQYQPHYLDTEQMYHGYHSGRIYQIDRQSQIVLALRETAAD